MFQTKLEVSPGKKGQWTLKKDLEYKLSDYILIRIPRGFKTDLASIPRVLRLVVQVNGRHRQAAVLHDYLYSVLGVVPFKRFSREACDVIFYEAMLKGDVPKWKARLMFLAVRVGGWASWVATK